MMKTAQLLAFALVAIFAFARSSEVRAEWHEASSDHFVIYSDTRADDLKRFAETLERFHRAMELESGRTVPPPSASSRVTVYMVGTIDNLREIYGAPNSAVGGFYIPRSSGSVAFVPNIRINAGKRDQSMATLLHEYAHHFLISSSPHAMPRWLSEGAAEYFASAQFPSDGSVEIGLPNNERGWELANAAPVSVVELFDLAAYKDRAGRRYDAYYGRSWLLYHYLRFEPDRRGQLTRYWAAVARGQPSLDAAKEIFGDFDTLEAELRRYSRQRRMAGMRFSPAEIESGMAQVRKLDDGHQAMMPVIIRTARGEIDDNAADNAQNARKIAQLYPQNAEALTALAAAERIAGNLDAAVAAADQAIALTPTVRQAYAEKGMALFAKANDAENPDQAYKEAMTPFLALNRIENDHTLPLIHLYRSQVQRGQQPTETARHALERAFALAPFDHDLAFEVALMLAAEGQTDLAALTLGPVAAAPHGGKRAERANLLRNAMIKATPGKPFDYSPYLLAPSGLEDGGEAEN